jgi:hypothetical protein
MKIIKHSHFYIFLLVGILHMLALSCATIPFRYITDEDMPALPSYDIMYPAMEFVVFSDPHFYIPKRGEKPATPSGGNSLGKLLSESFEIGEAALQFIREQNPGFVLIPGDLTENGDVTEHRQCAKLYEEFGYRESLYRDENSLSYIAEPVPGLWLFALDATCYEDPAAELGSYRYGAFPMETLFWIEDMLIKAWTEKKAVIVMMHYALLEHFKQQKQFFPTYVLEDFIQVAEMLSHYKVRLVFTGHFHSQDITLKRFQRDSFIYDIETGSLITYPCPLRLARILPSQELEITTHHVEATQSYPGNFLLHARQQLEEAMENYFTVFLTRYEFSEQEQALLVPQLTGALLAHTMGDELPPAVILNLEGLNFWHKTMVRTRKKQIEYIWHDLIPVDNNLLINLKDGTWQALPTR